ncbi:AAA family ATPase [Pleomorphovibrio marinus]|uniref:AAA family ATPase n=1 Tax=Pleomorphovibrio marinus TaxID=2164132 RepID=UPI000E0ABABB|nr:ATP-binding protein [Pleomorphovibrio marinus]
MPPIIISIIGPESTGKSTLAKDLAQHYGEPWVPEYAREYIDKLDRPYNYDDLSQIAKGQLLLQEKLAKKSKNLLFWDTDLQVIKVWSLHKYNKLHPWIEEKCQTQLPHFYILTNIDLPWEPDPQREHPDPKMRLFFFNRYLQIIQESKVPYTIARGNRKQRLEVCLQAIESYIHKKRNPGFKKKSGNP